ncbi:MAG: hypothetical protein R3C61_05110 [Bacteroidia bacterium]
MTPKHIFAFFLFLCLFYITGKGQKPEDGWVCTTENTDSVLTIRLTITDPVIKDQILITGLTLMVFPDGKKKNFRGIHYPLGTPEEARTNDPGQLREQRLELHSDPLSAVRAMDQLELINFYGKGEYTWGSSQNPGSVEAALQLKGWDTLIYTVKFPHDLIPTRTDGSDYKFIQLAFETGKLGRPVIRGDMGVGMAGVGGTYSTTGTYDRAMQEYLDEYRLFSVSSKHRVKQVILY